MLEFMGKALEVLVTGRDGQERRWDLAERVIPPDAPNERLSDDEYAERRLTEAMARFGVADLAHLKTRTYWVDKRALPRAIERFVDEGRMVRVTLPNTRARRPAWATPAALAVADAAASRTTLLSPFDPLIYDRDRTRQLWDFEYKLEMYVPRAEREFGHFTLPVVHDHDLVGRLDSTVDRRNAELIVNQLHWEAGPRPARVRRAVELAIEDLARFVGAERVRKAATAAG